MIPQFYKQFQHWGAQGTVWIYSDPHFGDDKIFKETAYGSNRHGTGCRYCAGIKYLCMVREQ